MKRDEPKIISVGFAVPPQSYTQTEVFEALGYPRQFRSIFLNAGVSKRHFWIPFNPYITWQEQCEEYERGQSEMTRRSIRACLDNRDSSDIGCIASAGCCGYACPGITQRIAKDMKFSPNVVYTNIWGHGCFTQGHSVMLKREAKDISEVREGDQVLGHDGDFHQVTRTFKRHFAGQILNIKPYGLPPIRATPEHPFLIIRPKISNRGETFKPDCSWGWGLKKWDWSPKWALANELRRGDFLLTPKPRFPARSSLKVSDFLADVEETDGYVYTTQRHNLYKNVIRRTTCKVIRNELLNRDFVRLCGLYVAEGSTYKGGIDFAFGESETALINEVITLCQRLGLKASVRKNKGKSLRVRTCSIILARLFRQWFGNGARTKKIPEWVFGMSEELKEVFIQGMWDGDGDIGEKSVRYSTASVTLAQQLVLLLASLGRAASWFTEMDNGFNHGIQQRLSLHFGKKNKKLWYDDDKYLWAPVKKVESEDWEGPVYNLGVEGSNSYVCNLVSVHNCEGGFPALKRCYDFTKATGKMSLAVSCELCSCAYFPEPPGKPDPTNDYENLRANAIFGDGSSAALIGYDDDPRHPYLIDFESYFDAQYIDLLGFIWHDGRLKCRLSRDIPKIAPIVAGRPIKAVLERNNLTLKDITWWVIHPGGSKVLDNIRDTLGLPEAKMSLSREALYNYGNCSSSSLGIVGKILMGNEVNPGDWGLVVSLGAGMASGATLLQFGE